MKPEPSLSLVVYTDAHGRYASLSTLDMQPRDYGLDRLSTRIKQLHQSGVETLVIDNGDSIQGMPLVDLYQPESGLDHPANQIHQILGVEAFIPGNHEFNFGLEGLLKIKTRSQAHWLSANILSNGQPRFTPYHIFEKAGLKIGVLGLITEFVPRWEHESQIPGLDFMPIVAEAQKWIPELREQCDLLAVSYHGGMATDPVSGESLCYDPKENEGLELLEQVEGIDLLICGHQHRRQTWHSPGGAWVVQAGSYGRCWAEIEVLRGASGLELRPQLIDANQYQPDPQVIEVFTPEIDRVAQLLEQPLGTAEPDFAISDPMSQVWTKKHPMIQWINQVIKDRTGADLVCTSLLDADLPGLPEQIKLRDIIGNYFFQDNLCVIEVTGKVLREALEQVASFFLVRAGKLEVSPDWRLERIKSYNYDIFDGIDYRFDLRQPVGSRVSQILFKGAEVGPEDLLQVGLTTYRAQGAFYQMFSAEQIVAEYPEKITELLVEDLRNRGHLKIEPKQNFQVDY